jgi:sec-independent protein translocase protein TatA
MSNLKGWEIIIVLALLLLLFGAKRLPDAARGLGRSMRIFKAETKGLRDDVEPARTTEVG